MRDRLEWRSMTAAGLCALSLVLAGCSGATPAWGPDTPRNGAGQPVDQTLGTPLPGYPYLPR